MKILKITALLVVSSLLSFTARGQSSKIALSLYKKLGYKVSIPKFQKNEEMSLDNITRVANSYRLNHDTPNAEMWYSYVVEASGNAIDYFYYAQALQSNEKYDLAKEYYLKYDAMISGESGDKRGALLAASIDRMEDFKHAEVELQNESVLNTSSLDFSPMYYEDQLIFVSNRFDEKLNSGIKDLWTNDNFMAIWKAERNTDGTITAPEIFSEKITTKFHEGPVAFNKSGNRVFFTRNDFKYGIRRNNSKGIMKLQIYTSTKDGNEWSKPSELSINTKEYDEAHPALSPDGRKLYFCSDREGGYGGMDVYVSEFKNGEWMAPTNLGPELNTSGNDVFPYVHDDGTLYFASDGWEGLGGLDIYEAKKDKHNTWIKAENIGTPFNSPKDDFALIMNEAKTEGYLTSARVGGHGKDDIYSFRKSGVDINEITVCAYEVGTEKRLPNVEVLFSERQMKGSEHAIKLIETDVEDEYLLKFNNDIVNENASEFTNSEGVFKMPVLLNKQYNLTAKKNGYKIQNDTMIVNPLNFNSEYEYCIAMEPKECLSMEGIVKNKSLNNSIPNATITLVNRCTGDELKVTSNSEGRFDFPCIDCECDYLLKGEKSYFDEGISKTSTVGLNCSSGEKIDVVLELIPSDIAVNNNVEVRTAPIQESTPVESNVNVSVEINTAPTVELARADPKVNNSNEGIHYFEGNKIEEGAVIALPNFYYDFNKFDIRDDASIELDKIVYLLRKYPTLTIELGSHTDSRGSGKYNLKLSQNRANAAVQYIIKEGIRSSRLVAKGYGETQLRNKCANLVDCSEEDHQYNRRTEIRVLKFENSNIDVKYLDNLPNKIDRANPSRKSNGN